MLEVGPGNVATLANRLGVSRRAARRRRRSCSAAATCPRSTWPWATAPSPTGACTTTRSSIAKIEQVDEDGDVEVLDQAVPDRRAGAHRGAGRPRHLLPPGGREGGTGARPPSASRPPARPAPPRTTRTPGSSATRPSSPPRCGWATPTRCPTARVPTMDEDSPVSRSRGLNGVTGGSLPAAIWRKFMVAATEGDDTGSLRASRPTFPGTRPARASSSRRPPPRPTSSTSSDHASSTDVDHRAHEPRPRDRRRAPRRPPPPTTDHDRRPTPSTDRAARRARPPASVDELVGVAGAAGEAPALDLVEHLDLLLLVPRLGREVDAVERRRRRRRRPRSCRSARRHVHDMPAVPTAGAAALRSAAERPYAVRHRRQPRALDGTGGACDAHEAHRARHPGPQGPRRRRAARDGHRLRRARRAHGRRGRGRPDPGRRLASPWSCSATTTPCRSPSTTWPTTPPPWPGLASRAERAEAFVVADLPWMSYHAARSRTPCSNAAQLIRAGAQAREARGRPQAPADDRGDRRRRDPGDGPPRPHPAVGPRHGRLQGAGPRARAPRWSWSPTPRRWPRAGCFAIVLEGVPDEVARMVTDAVDVPTIGIGAGPGTATARCSCSTTCSASRTASRRSSCAATPTLKADGGRRAVAPSPPTCAPGAFPAAAESYHLSAEVAETLGLYGLGAHRRLTDAIAASAAMSG